jgi:hypothetical protein
MFGAAACSARSAAGRARRRRGAAVVAKARRTALAGSSHLEKRSNDVRTSCGRAADVNSSRNAAWNHGAPDQQRLSALSRAAVLTTKTRRAASARRRHRATHRRAVSEPAPRRHCDRAAHGLADLRQASKLVARAQPSPFVRRSTTRARAQTLSTDDAEETITKARSRARTVETDLVTRARWP